MPEIQTAKLVSRARLCVQVSRGFLFHFNLISAKEMHQVTGPPETQPEKSGQPKRPESQPIDPEKVKSLRDLFESMGDDFTNLVLQRKQNESIVISDPETLEIYTIITFTEQRSQYVKLGCTAHVSVSVDRHETYLKKLADLATRKAVAAESVAETKET